LPTTSDVDKLAERRYVTVILRLLIDQQQRLICGEVVDTEGQAQGQFIGWRELIRMVREYLANQQR